MGDGMAGAGELLLDPRMARGARARGQPWLAPVLAAIAALAIAVPTLVVVRAHVTHGHGTFVMLPRRVVPAGELPRVEPVRLVALGADAARAYNADQPFAPGPMPAAAAFRYAGGADDRARAADCLAAAALYEAGDDAAGERAVAQVVLNRLRHPAFPKSVCAVVFEGAERASGCQFTFACDGALTRWHPAEAAWARARAVAAAALAGGVDGRVGYATHYHTDWVVPYWQASLDKIAAVGPHLFFRWSGWWGTPAAFDRRPVGAEPVVAALAAVSPVHRVGMAAEGAAADGAAAEGAAIVPGTPFFGRTLRPLASDPDTFLTTLGPERPREAWRTLALQACGERARCLVLGWTDPAAMAFTVPLPPEARAALSFSYRRDRALGIDRAQWNCAEVAATPPGACLAMPAKAQPAAVTADARGTPRRPDAALPAPPEPDP